MATFVICHGAWDGGWFWKEPASQLRKLGHEVYTPTLTGLGERKHLATPETNLDTHIQDIINVIVYENLNDVLLVGHSYGGMVVTGVAERCPEKISKLVYIDGYVPQDGQSTANLLGDPSLIEQLRQFADAYGEGWRIPFPAAPPYDERVTDHPLQTMLQPIEIKNQLAQKLPRTYVACTERGDAPHYASIAQIAQQAKLRGWQFYELPTGHNPNLTMPHETTQLLDQISKR